MKNVITYESEGIALITLIPIKRGNLVILIKTNLKGTIAKLQGTTSF